MSVTDKKLFVDGIDGIALILLNHELLKCDNFYIQIY